MGAQRLSWFWRLLAAIVTTLVRVLRWRIDVRGLEHVPRRGGAVLAFNHHSYLDFIMVAWPVVRRARRPVRFLAKREVLDSRKVGWMARKVGAVPVDRGSAEARSAALDAAVAALRDGDLVVVAPEQTISPSFELLPLRTGAARMAQAAGVPIAAPSANRFSYVSPTSADHVLEDLGDRIDMVVDSGRTEHGIESTVAALDGSELVILRHGAVTLEALQATVGDLVRVRASGHEDRETRSPGRQRRHYSPRSPTVALRPSVLQSPPPDSLSAMTNVVYMGYEDRPPALPTAWTFRSLGRLADLTTVAFDLYDNLRRHDAPGTDRVILAELTEMTQLGAAIDDRLIRAAGGRLVSSAAELEDVLGR
jgi:1-acyl-sn-glycerol-3-phosphate acyltransferase